MAEKNLTNEVKSIVQPTERLVQGNLLFFDPDTRCNPGQNLQKLDHGLESTVKRLIEHLKDEKKLA
jgi:hypothetical protein